MATSCHLLYKPLPCEGIFYAWQGSGVFLFVHVTKEWCVWQKTVRQSRMSAWMQTTSKGLSLADKIFEIEGVRVPLGRLDISFYRDDFATHLSPEVLSTQIDFDIDGLDVVLVDDVLFTGRTIRSALDALMDIGRPQAVQLAVLIDRGHRELPIRADFVGKNVPSASTENVRLFLEEVDGRTEVEILSVEPGERIGSAPLGGE